MVTGRARWLSLMIALIAACLSLAQLPKDAILDELNNGEGLDSLVERIEEFGVDVGESGPSFLSFLQQVPEEIWQAMASSHRIPLGIDHFRSVFGYVEREPQEGRFWVLDHGRFRVRNEFSLAIGEVSEFRYKFKIFRGLSRHVDSVLLEGESGVPRSVDVKMYRFQVFKAGQELPSYVSPNGLFIVFKSSDGPFHLLEAESLWKKRSRAICQRATSLEDLKRVLAQNNASLPADFGLIYCESHLPWMGGDLLKWSVYQGLNAEYEWLLEQLSTDPSAMDRCLNSLSWPDGVTQVDWLMDRVDRLKVKGAGLQHEINRYLDVAEMLRALGGLRGCELNRQTSCPIDWNDWVRESRNI